MTIQTSDNKFSVSKWIVDPIAGIGTHTTIQDAINTAISGESIFVRPGTYIEDLTLKAGVSLQSFVGNESGSIVVVIGKTSYSGIGATSVTGISFATSGDFCLEVTGANASILNVENCSILAKDNTAISFTNSNTGSTLSIKESSAELDAIGIAFIAHTGLGKILIANSFFTNPASSITKSTISSGVLEIINSDFFSPIISSGTGELQFIRSNFEDVTNSTNITHGSSVESFARFCFFSGGVAPALNIGGASTFRLFDCEIDSSNANIVVGGGTLNYSGIISRQGGGFSATTVNGSDEFIGRIRSPTQPAFLAVLPSVDTDVTGDGTVFQLGSATALTEIFDQNGDFNTNGTFTAPVTGIYFFTGYFLVGGITNAMDISMVTFITTNRTYTLSVIDVGVADTNPDEITLGGAIIADMNSGDTCTFNLFISGGALDADVFGDGTPTTFFSGHLLF